MTATTDATTVDDHRRVLSPWWLFGALLVACWVVLLARHSSGHAAGHSASLGTAIVMWTLMAVAMMAPTAIPVLAALRQVLANGSMRPWWAFFGAYLVVWAGFAVGAAIAQMWLIDLHLVGASGSSASVALTTVLLAVAGGYQLTPWKGRCLTQCVSPMTFFFRTWRDGTSGGVRMGVRHGLSCVGCCWALMLLAFVGGIANTAFMVLSAGIMALEKLPALGRRLTVPLGILLLCASAWVLVTAPDHVPSHHHHAMSVVEREVNGQLDNRG